MLTNNDSNRKLDNLQPNQSKYSNFPNLVNKTNYQQFGTTGFNTPQTKFGATTANGFRSQSSSKREDFYIFAKLNKKEMFGYDNEKLQETILGIKKELSQKCKEVNALKVELNLLNNEDKKKLKIIENILSSSGKSFEEIVSIIDDNKQIDKIDLTANSVIKLREIYVINFLKSQVGQLKMIIKDKDEEIRNLKESSRITKITHLENESLSLQNESNQIKTNLEKLTVLNENLKTSYNNLKLEFEALYKKYLKKGRDYDKNTAELSKLQEENKLLLESKKKADQESNKCKVTMINMKEDLKYKTDCYNTSKISEEKIEKLEKDKENLIKKIDTLNKETVKLNFQIKYVLNSNILI
ncbi:MAG: hypothetical protein ACK5YA_00795 [bacterium]